MSTDLTTFGFHGQPVRTATLDDAPAVVLTDIAKVLGYRDANTAGRTLREHHRGYAEVRTPGGTQQMLVVTEQGFNRLVMRSNAANAEEVQDWVTDEVLPSIRRTGGYVAPVPDLDELEVAERYVNALREKRALAAEVVQLTPRAEAWDVMVDATGDYAVDEAAKVLSRDPNITIGRTRLFSLMGELGWIFRQGKRGRWHAYQTAVESGRLTERLSGAFLNTRTQEMEAAAPTIRITTKGLAALRERLARQEAS